MDKKKVWGVSNALAMVVIVGGGWFFGIAPQLAVIASADQNRENVEAQNAAYDVLLVKLEKDYQKIDDLKQELDSLRASVPETADLSTFVIELNALANLHQIIVKSISVSDAKPYTPPPAPTGASANAPSATLTNPKITSANFIVIPVQFSVTGDYAKILNFVQDVQTGPRLFLVSAFSSIGSTKAIETVNTGKKSAATTSEEVDSMIGGFVYVLQDSGKK